MLTSVSERQLWKEKTKSEVVRVTHRGNELTCHAYLNGLNNV